MSWAAVAAAGASVIGGVVGSKGAKSAAKKAKKGSQAELDLIREGRDIARADTRHTRQAGATALNALMRLTGLAGPGGGAQYDENGWPIENTGGAALGAPEPVAPEQPGFMPDAQPIMGRQSAYGRAYGGPLQPGTIYNINEYGPENVYSGGAMTRGRGPATIDGRTGYVEPNIEGRFIGGLLASGGSLIAGALSGGGSKPKRGKLPGTDWQYNAKGKLAATGYGHWNEGQGQYVDRRGRPKQNQAAPPEGYVKPQMQTDIDTTQGMDYNFQTDPGYQFRFEEGQRALDRGAAARGGLLSGGYGRKAIRYGQGFASNEYTNVYNRIANIAGMGQTANQFAGNAAMQGGYGMGAAAGAKGINSAYGDIGSGNAWATAANQLGQIDWRGNQQPTSQGPYGAPPGETMGGWGAYNPFENDYGV